MRTKMMHGCIRQASTGFREPGGLLYGEELLHIPDNLLIDLVGIIVARGLRGEALAVKLAESFK